MQVVTFAGIAGVTFKGKVTQREARGILQALGLTLTRDSQWDEYRVNFKGGSEGTAYYTDCLLDALQTGLDMAREGDRSCRH